MHVLSWLDDFYPKVGPSAVAFIKVQYEEAPGCVFNFFCFFPLGMIDLITSR